MDIDNIISNAITATVEHFGEDNVPHFAKGIDSKTLEKARDFQILMEYSNNLLQLYHAELQKSLLNNGIKI